MTVYTEKSQLANATSNDISNIVTTYKLNKV